MDGSESFSTESSLDRSNRETASQVSKSVTSYDTAAISRTASSASSPGRRTEGQRGPLDTIAEDDPELNPTSGRFEPYKWARIRLNQLDKEGILHKHAGVVFKNLNVSGSGAALQLQDTVDSALSSPFRLDSYRGMIHSAPKRQILHNFDGVLKSGEMLMVLGRPGSGCSTFQKTICGELHGLELHPESVMHYNGIPMKKMHKEFKGECVYNQEVDKHFPHLTVGETLEFAASARTPSHRLSGVSRKHYVKETTQVAMAVLGLYHTYNTRVGDDYIRGVSGGERKRVSIAEMALSRAPLLLELLIFLDEPTSGLDSQSAWSICAFLRKLADNGQAVLSTIHQPSAILFQEFYRLLFLAKGGRTVYFGEIGEQSITLLDYFERNGARKCDPSENPAEYMLEIIGAGAAGHAAKDWPLVWKESPEAREVEAELRRIRAMVPVPNRDTKLKGNEHGEQGEYAMPITDQLLWVTRGVFQQYWREPAYIGAKFMLGVVSALFIGFSYFKPGGSLQGIQNRLFSTFMLNSIFSTLVQQIMPKLVTQRSLYEVRERPSKTYSWAAFIVSNVVVEIPYQVFLGILVWASYYYPIYGASQSSDKQGLMLLFVIQFFLFTVTFAELVISSLPDAETAGTIATLAFALILTFNGVMQTPTALPGFWIFMYRVSPLTYLIAGINGNALHSLQVHCAGRELSVFSPPQGQTCGQYLADWLSVSPGQLYNPSATKGCEFCAFTTADQYMAQSKANYNERWRNWGIGWAYIGFNIAGAAILYYVFRVRHYKPTLLPRVVKACGKVLHRLFRRRSGSVPQGKEAENSRVI